MASGIVDNHFILSSWDVAQRSATAGNREDLLDIITMISPTETPLFTGLRKDAARGVRHEWLLDSLATFGDPENGVADVSVTPESYDATFTTPAVRKRLGNYTHILRETVDVSDTQRAVNTAGIEDEYTYQLRKRLIELARKIEFAIIHSELATQAEVGNVGGTPAVGRMMEGVLAWLEPDPSDVSADYLSGDEEGTITEAGSPIARLTEEMYGFHCQKSWDKGALYKTVYVNSVQKREISAWYGPNTYMRRNLDANARRLVTNIDIYDGDFGLQAIILHRYLPARYVLTLDEDYWFISVLRPILALELARAGNSTRAMIEAELTVEARMPATGGKIINCSNFYGTIS